MVVLLLASVVLVVLIAVKPALTLRVAAQVALVLVAGIAFLAMHAVGPEPGLVLAGVVSSGLWVLTLVASARPTRTA